MAILITNQRERNEDAKKQDETCAFFESTMQRTLNSLTRTIVDDFAVLYATTGQIVDTTNYNSELEAILTRNYRRTNNEFSQDYLDNLIIERNRAKTDARREKLDNVINLRKTIEPIIVASLIRWAHAQTKRQRLYITNTWDKIINKNIDNITAEQILNDKPIDHETIAKKTKTPLKNELINHNKTIAAQEIRTSASNAKFTEANELNDAMKTDETVDEKIIKTWITVGDSHVRDEHRAANNQKRDLDDPFMVGGELLQYPRDTSLGASLWNVINCRCSTSYQ